jgi:hypothetical protein
VYRAGNGGTGSKNGLRMNQPPTGTNPAKSANGNGRGAVALFAAAEAAAIVVVGRKGLKPAVGRWTRCRHG